MSELFVRQRPLLDEAVSALQSRGLLESLFGIPARRCENTKAAADSAFAALLDKAFDLPGHPGARYLGAETSPYGRKLGQTRLGPGQREPRPPSYCGRVALSIPIMTRLH